MTDSVDDEIAQLGRERDYYKRNVDELASEQLKLEYTLGQLRHQLKQKRQGFSLLTELSRLVGPLEDVDEILRLVAGQLLSPMGMDRAAVLRPAGDGAASVTSLLGGGSGGGGGAAGSEALELGERAQKVLVVNSATQPDEAIEAIRRAVGVPFFVCVPVRVDQETIGWLVAGRLLEARPRSPPLDDGDADTLASIAELVAASVQATRLKVLKELDALKEKFFANISHDFRTPITLTLGPLDALMSGRHGDLPEAARGALETMRRNQQRLLTLINEIMDLAKLEAGKMALAAAPVASINRWVEERATLFRGGLEQAGVQLVVELDPAADEVPLFVDGALLDKAYVNLLSNARKFTSHGRVRVATRVTDPDTIAIDVEDSGIGIKAEELPSVFDRFRQAAGSASQLVSGTGIGLSLVKEVVELHGGEIKVASEYGKGTTFTIVLRRGKDHFPEGTTFSEAAAETASRGPVVGEQRQTADTGLAAWNESILSERRGRPLVVFADDNPDLRTLVRDVLSPDVAVVLAFDGEDAYELVQRVRPDLVLSDLMMPRLDGIGLLQRLRGERDLAAIPFVLLTAQGGQETRLEGLASGADDYLTKPFNGRELSARVHNLLRLRAQQLRIHRDLAAARAIQQSLLPLSDQRIGSLRVSSLYRPCEDLSGDFFDISTVDDTLYAYVADVTSHGTAAAQVTYLVKGLFRRVLDEGMRSLPEIHGAMAREYREYGLPYEVALHLLAIGHESGRVTSMRANAAPAMIAGAGGVRALAPPPAAALGGGAAHTGPVGDAAVAEDVLSDAESLFIFTDGAYELPTPSGRQVGLRRLGQILTAARAAASWQVALTEALTKATGDSDEWPDDVTVLRVDR